ncbi:hypothetical protein [Thermococcus pacificus]|uniref:Uncharacterized protein n=1 Tax=Thermococcus pacificus TaxID=71998 RepID=A0A218P806_9EURY|nr:hypothetical protein [Thermococcus pacificus]ASJ06919.1 hypothetical protein A3L08_06075 [Thermococcus pacificus]
MGKTPPWKALFTFPAALAILGLLWGTGPSVTYVQVNGTFSGGMVVPSTIADEVEDYFSNVNATLYSFEAKVVGEMNASITTYALKVTPPFDPDGFEIIINAHPVNGTTYVPYAEGIPVSVRYMGHSYRSVLTVRPTRSVGSFGEWSEEYLGGANGSRLLKVDSLTLVVDVVEPGHYDFVIVKEPENLEISRDGLILEGNTS